MHKTIVSDTSILVLFDKIEEFDLLRKIYKTLIITPEVVIEFGGTLPDWIEIKGVSDKKYLSFLETQVDLGEASVLALASEFNNVLLLLDDLKARKLASQLGFKFTGALGIIHKAKRMGVIEKVKPLIEKIIRTDFRISKEIIQHILDLNGELD